MSEHTKKRHTKQRSEKTLIPRLYIEFGNESHTLINVPMNKVLEMRRLISSMGQYKEDRSDWRESFRDVYESIGGTPEYRRAANAIRTLRKERQLTQKDLSVLIGVKQSNISKIENAHIPVGKRVAMRLSRVFNMGYKLFLTELSE